MADPLSTVASALTVIAGAAKVCESVHALIKNVRSAPSNIGRLAYELRSTSTVLHTLHHTLAIENEKGDLLSHQTNQRMVGHIFDLVFYTQKVLDNVSAILEPFTYNQKDGWKNQRRLGYMKVLIWELSKKNEVLILVRTLESYKMTLNLACLSLQVFNDYQTHSMVQRLQTDVSSLLGIINSNQSEHLPARQSHRILCSDTGSHVNVARYTIPLQRFLDRTSSVISLASEEADVSICELASDTGLGVCHSTDSQGLPTLAPGNNRPGGTQATLQRSPRAVVELDAPPSRLELESPSVVVELDACNEESATLRGSLNVCGTEQQESLRRPTRALSFAAGCDDVLDVVDSASYASESSEIETSRSSNEAIGESSHYLPTSKDTQLEFGSNSTQLDSFDDSPGEATSSKPAESSTSSVEVEDEKPKLKLVIPNEADSTPIQQVRQGSIESSSSPTVSPLSSTIQNLAMLPPLDLGAIDISPLKPNPTANSFATPNSTSTSQLPELDLGPDITPDDPDAPWSPSSSRPNPFPFDFVATKHGTVDERWQRYGKERDVFVRYDALSPVVIEQWL